MRMALRYSWITRQLAFVFGAIVVLVIAGCSQHQSLSDALDDYHQRLANILDENPVEIDFVANINIPSKSTLFRQPQSISINFREFYSLPNCRLNTLIAQRNTGMGKTQLPSQRFVYETELLAALTECIQISEDATVKTKLAEVLDEKRRNYPDTYANLIQASDEVLLSFARDNGFVSGDLTDGFQETRIALQYLLDVGRFTGPGNAITSEQLEASLKDLEQFRLVARIWRSQQLITQWFQISSPWLKEHTSTLDCDTRSGKETLQYLNNVFMLFFAEKIQPIAGQINNYHYQFLPIFTAFTQDQVLTESWRDAVNQQISKAHQDYKQAMQAHILVWQQLFERCGISPSA